MWFHKCVCTRVIDGDTIDLVIDLGFGVKYSCRVRLFGIDTSEINSKDSEQRKLAQLAKSFMQDTLEGKPCHIYTFKSKEKYGRYLAEVFIEEKQDELISVNNLILERSLGNIYED